MMAAAKLGVHLRIATPKVYLIIIEWCGFKTYKENKPNVKVGRAQFEGSFHQ